MHAFISPFGQVSLRATELSRIAALIGKHEENRKSRFFLWMVPKNETKSTSSWMKIEQCFSRWKGKAEEEASFRSL